MCEACLLAADAICDGCWGGVTGLGTHGSLFVIAD